MTSCRDVGCPGMNDLNICIRINPCPAKQKDLDDKENKIEQETRVPVNVRKREDS